MPQKLNWKGALLNTLILIALFGMASLGWVAGHIIRFSIPADAHPPIPEIRPEERFNIENGFDFEFLGVQRNWFIQVASLSSSQAIVCISNPPDSTPRPKPTLKTPSSSAGTFIQKSISG